MVAIEAAAGFEAVVAAGLSPFCNPVADQRGLLALALERVNRRRRAIEHRNRVAPILSVAIRIGHDRTEKAAEPFSCAI